MDLSRRLFLTGSAKLGIAAAAAALPSALTITSMPRRSLAELDIAFQRCGVVAKPAPWSIPGRPIFCFLMTDDQRLQANARGLFSDYQSRRQEFKAFVMAQASRPLHLLD